MQDAEGFWSAIFVHHSNPPGSLLYAWMQIPGKEPYHNCGDEHGVFQPPPSDIRSPRYLGSQPEVKRHLRTDAFELGG